MNPILLGGLAGLGAGAALLFLSHIAPRFGAGSFVRDTDEPRVLGMDLTRREAHLLGAILHLALSLIFGAVYALCVQQGIFSGYDLLSLGGYAVILTLFNGGIVMPLEGHGLFGVKEDSWFPVDLLVTNVFWAVLFGVVMAVWA